MRMRREKKRNVAVQSSVHHAPVSRINITAHCSAKYLIFLPFLSVSALCFLSKYQPAIHPSSLVLNYLTPSIFYPLAQASMLICFHCLREIRAMKKKYLPKSASRDASLHTTPSLKHCFQVNFSLAFQHTIAVIHLSLVFFFLSFSLSVSPTSLKNS